MIKRTAIIFAAAFIASLAASAGNYVNWRADFWISIPDDWEKVAYETVDFYLAQMDTSQAIFDYEAVFAPESSKRFIDGPYVFIRFDSTGQMTKQQVRARMQEIADTYANEISETSIVDMLTDLQPGKPEVDWDAQTISVLTEMAAGQEKKMLWQYIRFVEKGMVTFYFFSPLDTFDENRELFREIADSFSTENLENAAGGSEYQFTEVTGDEPSAAQPVDEPVDGQGTDNGKGTMSGWLPWLVGALILIYLIWRFGFASRRKRF